MWPRPTRRSSPRSCSGVLAGAFIALGAVLSTTIGTGSELGLRHHQVARRHRVLARPDPGRRGGRRAVHREQPDRDERGQRQGPVSAAAAELGHRLRGNFVGALSRGGHGLARATGGIRVTGPWGPRPSRSRRRRRRCRSAWCWFEGCSRTPSCAWRCGWRRAAGRSSTRSFAIMLPDQRVRRGRVRAQRREHVLHPRRAGCSRTSRRVRRVRLTTRRSPASTSRDSCTNLAAATIGNVIGGAVLVGLVYWFVYLRPKRDSS